MPSGWKRIGRISSNGWESQIVLVQPYPPSYRYVTEAGAWVTVDALIDQRLLRPTTRSNGRIPGGWPPRAAMVPDLARLCAERRMMEGTWPFHPSHPNAHFQALARQPSRAWRRCITISQT